MKIGIPREIKRDEYRVGLTPAGAAEYVAHGHEVTVESGGGLGSGFSNEEYQQQGCRISTDRVKLFAESEMIIKVKEPLPEEYELFHEGQIYYTYLHLAANRELTEALLAKR